MKNNRKGFTIIEIVVVIAILGILLALGVPSYLKVRDKAQERAFDGNIRTLTMAATMFQLDYPSAPTIWSPFANQVADPSIEITSTKLHDSWNLYVGGKYPSDPTRAMGSTYTVEIGEDGSITVSPSTYGE